MFAQYVGDDAIPFVKMIKNDFARMGKAIKKTFACWLWYNLVWHTSGE
jgi:hypothetical protein